MEKKKKKKRFCVSDMKSIFCPAVFIRKVIGIEQTVNGMNRKRCKSNGGKKKLTKNIEKRDKRTRGKTKADHLPLEVNGNRNGNYPS